MIYYTMADIERLGPAGCLKHMNELHETNSRLQDEGEMITTICAICYQLGPCVDDGEAYICADREACKVRATPDPEFVTQGMAIVRVLLERNNAKNALRLLLSDVRALGPAFQFHLPASVHYAEALLDGLPDWREDGKRRAADHAGEKPSAAWRGERLPRTTGRYEIRQDEETGRRYWFGSEDGWKDETEIGANGVITLSVESFPVGTTLMLIEPDDEL